MFPSFFMRLYLYYAKERQNIRYLILDSKRSEKKIKEKREFLCKIDFEYW